MSEDEGFWTVYRTITSEVPVRENLVPDAHLAALLRSHGVKTLYTPMTGVFSSFLPSIFDTVLPEVR